MLYNFVYENRDDIVQLACTSLFESTEDRQSHAECTAGLETFFGHLVSLIRNEGQGLRSHTHRQSDEYSYFLSNQGYLVNHVVLSYGALCQAVSHVALNRGVELTRHDYLLLNSCLDFACAEAVTAFNERKDYTAREEESLRLGALAHELRNSLNAALTAFQVLKKGDVKVDGATGAVLQRNLLRMGDLTDRALAKVRLEAEKDLHPEKIDVFQALSDIQAMAALEAQTKNISLRPDVTRGLEVEVDRQLFISAFSNVVKNAIKYSRDGGLVQVRGRSVDSTVLIEVEDQCGGLPSGKAEELSSGSARRSKSHTGMGLGLSIAREAIDAIGGEIGVKNLPGQGCVFSIKLPKAT